MDEEHRAVRQTAREFAESELRPIVLEWESEREFPDRILESFSELAMRGFRVDPEYGGNGMDMLAHVVVVEEISKVWPSAGFKLSEPLIRAINAFGNERQKREFLPQLTSGDAVDAIALSEPDHGTDFAGIRTTAERVQDGYLLNGTKMWCTNAGDAEYIGVAAKTDPEERRDGISIFVVDADADGVEVEPPLDLFVHRASNSHEVVFDDCFVPEERLLGEENRGFYHMMDGLNDSRIQAAARGLGIAAGAYQEALAYAQERETFGKRIADFQAIKHKLADMKIKVEAARHLVYEAARKCDAGEEYTVESSMAKVFASEAAREVATEAVQIHGGYGVSNEFLVSVLYRDAKVIEIYDGTNEIQRTIIGNEILG
jgi:alkylation response protein AidB-like acyl-CoA dehydrogenase